LCPEHSLWSWAIHLRTDVNCVKAQQKRRCSQFKLSVVASTYVYTSYASTYSSEVTPCDNVKFWTNKVLQHLLRSTIYPTTQINKQHWQPASTMAIKLPCVGRALWARKPFHYIVTLILITSVWSLGSSLHVESVSANERWGLTRLAPSSRGRVSSMEMTRSSSFPEYSRVIIGFGTFSFIKVRCRGNDTPTHAFNFLVFCALL
jgi:hypothetical protein